METESTVQQLGNISSDCFDSRYGYIMQQYYVTVFEGVKGQLRENLLAARTIEFPHIHGLAGNVRGLGKCRSGIVHIKGLQNFRSKFPMRTMIKSQE